MPELPEVETIRRDLAKKIVDKEIGKIELYKDSAIKGDQDSFIKSLENNHFSNLNRKAKLLVFQIADTDKYILTHLRMTGKLVYDGGNENEFPTKHTGIIIHFEGGGKLYFDDIRTFGYMQVVDSKEKQNLFEEKFGIEPLTDSFTFKNWNKALENRRTSIKNLLLNQRVIAGIGNIYADEICFESGVRPDKKIPDLSEQDIRSLYENIEKILDKAINYRGTTFRNYVDSQGNGGNFASKLKAYGRDGGDCFGCDNDIKKIKLNGRGTHFCETCQK